MKANIARKFDATTPKLATHPAAPESGRWAAKGRILGLISLLMLLLMLPAAVQAQFTYTTNNGTLTITRYTGSGGAVDIPDVINGLPVTSIGDQVFFNKSNLTSVVIGTNVASIGLQAFWSCTGLTSVTIPNGVTNIGQHAFESCSSLTSVAIPNGLTSIANGLFYNCAGLTSVTIPKSVTNIAQNAFKSCTNLKGVSSLDSVTDIGFFAFENCGSLTNITFGTNLTRIRERAFSICRSLPNVTIPKNVTNIEHSAFGSCGSLRGVFFAGNPPTLGSSVFFGAEFSTIYYLPGTTNWGSYFGGRPAKLWNPSVLTTDASFGVWTNQFGFTITGTANIPIVVEACSILGDPAWVSLQNCRLTNGSLYFSDSEYTNHPARIYRLRSP